MCWGRWVDQLEGGPAGRGSSWKGVQLEGKVVDQGGPAGKGGGGILN